LRSPVTRQGLRSPVSRRQTSKELSGNFVTRSDVETGSGQSTGRIRVGGEDRDFETVSTVADRTGDVSTVDSVSRSRTEGTFFRGRQSSESTENVIRQDQYDARVKEAVQDAYKETDATVTELSSLGRGSDGLTVKGDTTVIDRTGSTGTGNSGSGGSAFSSSGAGGGGRQVFSSSGSREGAETGGSSGVDPENLNPSSQTVEDVVSDVEGGSGGEGASAGFAASLGSGQTRETGGGEVSFTGKGPVSFDYSSATVQETGSTKRKTIQETGGGQSTSQRTSSRSGKSSGGTGGQVTQVDTGSSTSRTGFNVSTNTGTGQRENNRAVPGVSTSVGQSNRAGNRQRNNVNLGIGTGLAVSNRAANVQSQNARTTNKQRFGTAFTSSPGRSGGRGSAGFGFGASNFDFEAFETGNERSSGSESSSSVAPGLISYTLAEAQGEETSIDYSEGDSLVFGAPTEAESEGSLDTEFYSGVGGDLFK